MRPLTLSLGVIVVSLAATFACTNASTIGENLSTDGTRQTKGDGGKDNDAAAQDAGPAPTPPAQDAGPAPTSCVQSEASGSGGSDQSCQYTEGYSCSDGTNPKISCTCGPGGANGNCVCATGPSFGHDCTKGCSPTDAERAACNVPKPPTGGGGSSGSSGASSGSTSSSSGASGSSSGGSTSSSGG